MIVDLFMEVKIVNSTKSESHKKDPAKTGDMVVAWLNFYSRNAVHLVDLSSKHVSTKMRCLYHVLRRNGF